MKINPRYLPISIPQRIPYSRYAISSYTTGDFLGYVYSSDMDTVLRIGSVVYGETVTAILCE